MCQVRTSRTFIFTIAACCIWQTPGLLALFKLGVLQKVWFRPQVGNFLLFNTARCLGWFACRWSLHKLIIAVYDWFRCNTRKQSQFFFYPENLCVRAASLRKTRVEMFGNASVSRRWTRPRHSVRFSFPTPCTDEVTETAVIADNQKLGCNCPTLRKNANNAFIHSPVGFPSAESAQRAEEGCGPSGMEKRWLLCYVGWIQTSVLHAVCCCNRSVIPASQCFRRKSHIFVRQKCAKDPQPQDKKSAKRRVWWKAASGYLVQICCRQNNLLNTDSNLCITSNIRKSNSQTDKKNNKINTDVLGFLKSFLTLVSRGFALSIRANFHFFHFLWPLGYSSRTQRARTHTGTRVLGSWKWGFSVYRRDVTLISEVVSLRSIRNGRAH